MSKVKCQKFFKSGFSLAELLVVVAIIIIMTGALFASISGSKAQKDAENSARQVSAQLRQLQNEAINGKQIYENDEYKIICSFNFKTSTDRKGYEISYGKCPEGTEIIETFPIIKLNSGKGNVSMNEISGYFSAPHGISSGFPLTITFTAGGKSAYVCVCSSGNIFDTKNSTCGC